MELTELPADLASFVEHALASGTYPSAEALIADAVRVLRDQEAGPTARPHTPDTPAHLAVTTSTPEDLVQAMRQALATGEAGQAQQLALEGAQRYPTHVALQHYARVLAPPPARVVPASPAFAGVRQSQWGLAILASERLRGTLGSAARMGPSCGMPTPLRPSWLLWGTPPGSSSPG